MSSSRTVLAACALVCAASAAQALPNTTLTFIQGTGTVSATDSIEVWLRLTIDDTLTLDSSLGAPFGLDPADVPTEAYSTVTETFVPFASYTRVITNTAFGCGSNFVANGADTCGGGAYAFDFHTDNSDPAKPSFNWLETLNLAAGSYDYLFGTFKPTAPVAGTTYSFSSAYFTLNFDGYDADGAPLSHSYDLAATCASGEDGCEFTRTVIGAVPEPSTYAMLFAGLAGIAAMASRRRG